MKITAAFTKSGVCVYAHRGITSHGKARSDCGRGDVAELNFREVEIDEAIAAALPGFQVSLRMLRRCMERAGQNKGNGHAVEQRHV